MTPEPRSDSPLNPSPCAIVIGASSGIGAALSRRLAHQGYKVALLARRKAALHRLRDQINESAGGPQAVAYVHDVTNLPEIPALFQSLLRDLKRIDLIVYSAGINPTVDPLEFNLDKDRAMLETNLLGAVAWLGQAADLFARLGNGQIVAISSVAGDRGRVKNPGYNASKAGLDAYVEALRNRLTRHGVHVLTVKPGFVDTDQLKGTTNAFWVRSPDQVAEDIWRAIRGRKQLIYSPARWRLLMWIVRNTPSLIFRRLSF